MRSSSNINSSLKKKRRLGVSKKVGIWAIFILFFISLFVLGLTRQEVRISNVTVSGNSAVSKEDISNIVEQKLTERYLWIIPTDNFLLLKRGAIKNEILNDFKKVKTADIFFHSLKDIEITVTEREAKYLWCDGMPTKYKNCYFMDKNGFIFAEAPDFSGNPFTKYFGLIIGNPVGQSYFNSARFNEINTFFTKLNDMKFSPVSFNAVDESQYEVYLSVGGKIIFDDKKTFDKDIINLQAVIDSGYIKTDPASLQKIKYIDLRFGNKVVLKNN